jgi:putative DNA primase/helicase
VGRTKEPNPAIRPNTIEGVEQTPELVMVEEEPEAPNPTADAASRAEKYTDLGNACRFVARYRDKVLYCDSWGRWLVWDGLRWSADQKLEVGALAADLVRSLYSIAKKINNKKERAAFLHHIIKSESHRALAAMITLAIG